MTSAQQQAESTPSAPPRATGSQEEKILEVIAEVGQHQRAGNMLVSEKDGRLLRVLTAFGGAKHVVEIGTSVGYSGLWFALALTSTGGKLTTFDIDPDRLERAQQNFQRAGVAEHIRGVLGDAHEKVATLKGPIDLLFLDADKAGYLDYLSQLRSQVRPHGLIIAHNMVYPKPDPRYIEAVTKDAALETAFVHMDGAGMALTLKKS